MTKNLYTGIESEATPTYIDTNDGRVTSPTPEQLYAAGERDIVEFVPPVGTVIVPQTGSLVFDAELDAWVEIYDTETPEQSVIRLAAVQAAEATARAHAVAERIAIVAESFGGLLLALQNHLAVFSLAIPCDSTDVMTTLITSLAGSPTDSQRAAASVITLAYRELQEGEVTDSEIAAAWELIK